MLRRIRNLAEQAGKAIIISTHILPDVETVCDDVLILSRGKLRLADSLQTLTAATPELYLKVFGSAEQLVDSLTSVGLNAVLTDRDEIVGTGSSGSGADLGLCQENGCHDSLDDACREYAGRNFHGSCQRG